MSTGTTTGRGTGRGDGTGDGTGDGAGTVAGAGTTVSGVAREGRLTLYFLRAFRAAAPVFLDTEVDMSAVLAHRTASRAAGRKVSVVSYVVHDAARVLARHPEANAAIRGRYRPKVARYPSVQVRVAFDKVLNGQRIIMAAVLPSAETSDLHTLQDRIEAVRDGDPATMPEFSGLRLLHRLPWPAGPAAIRVAALPLRRRPSTLGTLAVTSLGHSCVDGLHTMAGTTVTLGLGRILDRPVVRDGAIAVAPVMRLNLTFDHRVIDGAEAADILSEIKAALEAFPPAG